MNQTQTLLQAQEALKRFANVRFTFFDMNGVPRGKIVPAKAAAQLLESGTGCIANKQVMGPNNVSIYPKELIEAHMGNLMIIPDLSTLHHVAWLPSESHLTGQFICGTYWNKSNPLETCSRATLKRLLSILDTMGLRIYSGTELEFRILEEKTRKPSFSGVESLTMLAHAQLYGLLTDLEQNARDSGIEVETLHTESDPGQLEMTTTPQWGITGVDNCAILKQSIKEQAVLKGLEANFMGRQSVEASGLPMHLNFSLWNKNDENVFWDEDSPDKLSDFAKHWLAGLIKHAGALTAISCPTMNCYLCLHTAFIPSRANWGFEDRSAMIRVKTNGPKGTLMENRLPSGISNPYLVMAAMLAAGMDGVVNKMSCPEPYGSSTADILPRSLKEALDCLQKDDVMVEAFGKTFVEWFVMSKTSSELDRVNDVRDEAKLIEIHNKMYAKLF